MTKTTRPAGPQDSFDANAERRSWLHERVRQHMLKMAPLALVAATPLTNTACDYIPEPCRASKSMNDWDEYVSSHAFWAEDNGQRIVILDLILSEPAIQLRPTYTIVGGSFLTSGKSDQLRIKPDADAKVITLRGTLICGEIASISIDVTIDLEPPDGGGADSDPIVKVLT